MLGAWTPLVASLALLLALWWMSRRLAFYFISTLYALTGNQLISTTIYALVILPGTLIHETSHWLMAQIVGVRTGAISVLPKSTGNGKLRLGSVDVRGGSLWQHTLIGLAPLLVGSLLTVALSYWLVDVEALGAAWRYQEWGGIREVLSATLTQPDAALGLYLLFTVSDAMFLSASDRAPIQRMLMYLALVFIVLYVTAYLLADVPSLPASWIQGMHDAFRLLAWGFAIALAVHITFTIVFAIAFALVRGLRQR
ncbi:MAG: hypothetical protein J5I90_11630 [Caldilineales bacterium]|nr:hypothetical protein [Caldilineales bacterium]